MVLATFLNTLFFVNVEMLVSDLSKLCFAGNGAFLPPALHFPPWEAYLNWGEPNIPLSCQACRAQHCSLSHQEGQADGSLSVFWNDLSVPGVWQIEMVVCVNALAELFNVLPFQEKIIYMGYIEKAEFYRRTGLWMLIFI